MGEQHFDSQGWRCHLYEAADADTLVVMPLLEGDGATTLAACAAEGCAPFHLLAIHHEGWNDIYTPWPVPSPFEAGVIYRGEGPQTLATVVNTLLPCAEARLRTAVRHRALVGYSTAGLFALYGAVTAAVFDSGASVSGALWAPGIVSHLEKALPASTLTRFYVSVGTKERKTRNPLLQSLAAQTEAVAGLLAAARVQTTSVRNPGNHFFEPEARMARAIKWLVDSQGLND